KPVPLARVNRIVINPVWCAESKSAVGAANEHHVGPPTRAHARQHVNVVVGRATGTVNRQEHLTGQSARVDSAPINRASAHVDCSDLVKRRSDIWVLRIGRTNTPETAALVSAANVEVAVAGHIECPPDRTVRNVNWSLPGRSAIGGTAKFSRVASEEASPKLILETVAHAGRGPIEIKPFLVAAVGGSVRGPLRPRLSAVCGAPDIAAKCIYQKAEIEKVASLVGVRHRVAAEDARLQGAGEMPCEAGICGITIA